MEDLIPALYPAREYRAWHAPPQGRESHIEQKNYNTAEQELKLMTAKTPKNVEANGNLLVAAFYNQDFDALGEEYKQLHLVKIDDEDLLGKIDFVLDKTWVFPSRCTPSPAAAMQM